MPLSAGEFVLPSFGGDPSQGLSNLTNRLYMRNMQQQRLSLQQEAKRQQSGQFLERFLDPKQYLTGTAYDPMIISSINEALQKGAQMAQEGADIPTMLMGLGQYSSKINDYSNKAKAINKQTDDAIAKMKEAGVKGYDFSALKDESLKQAFHHYDPKTGEDLGLQDINDVDPSRNYVMETLQKRPDLVTNASDIDEFAKNTEKTERTIDNTTVGPNMRTYKHKVGFIGQNYLQPEYDEQGQYKEAVPRYEQATDAGKAITHTFTDANGQEVQAPVRLLSQDVFNDLTQRKGVGDYLRGQVMKHLREYNNANGSNIDLDSPQANLVARAIAYDALKARAGGHLKETNTEGRPSAAEVNLHYYGGDEDRAYNKTRGRITAEADAEDEGLIKPKGKGNPKVNTIDALNEVMVNNPEYLEGIPEEVDGKAMIDVKNLLPKAQLKYGPTKFESYKNVFYDPQDHSFTVVKNDKKAPTEVYKLNDLRRFFHSVAAANGVENDYVDKSLKTHGYDDFVLTGFHLPPDLNKSLIEHRATLVNNSLSANTPEQRSQALKDANLKIPEGTVIGYSERGGWKKFLGNAPYAIQYIKPNGEKGEKDFMHKEELEEYLKKPLLKEQTNAAPSIPVSGSQSTPNLSPEEQEAYKKWNNK